jgi:hypothetical protein
VFAAAYKYFLDYPYTCNFVSPLTLFFSSVQKLFRATGACPCANIKGLNRCREMKRMGTMGKVVLGRTVDVYSHALAQVVMDIDWIFPDRVFVVDD